MKKKHFRVVLFLYFLLFVTDGIIGFREKNAIPADIIDKAHQAKYLFMEETPFVIQIAIASIMALSLLANLVGFIGMLFFWSKARYFFAFAVVFKILSALSAKWYVSSSPSTILGGVGILFDGIILSLVFWGCAKPLFETWKTGGKPGAVTNKNEKGIEDLQ